MPAKPIVDLSPYFLTLADLEIPFGWETCFGNDRPVEIDVGSGRGLFLVDAAQSRPDVNFLGIEIDYAVARRAAKRLQKRALPNARIIGGDARSFLAHCVPAESVAAVHIYFPDPWWKRKHLRRRLITDEFVSILAGILQPGGLVHAWTDVEDYFAVIRALLDHDPRFESLPPPPENTPAHDFDFRTGYERKGRMAGSVIQRGLWRRK